jgi:transcription antitermination factor NusG
MWSYGSLPMNLAWYAVSMKPRHEKAGSFLLTNKGLEVFNPVCRTHRRWSDRIKELEVSLFPGYILCRFGFEQRMAVLTTPGVTSIVSAGRQPVPVSDEEINSVQSIVASRRHAMPWPYLSVGRRVQVAAGCLEGLVGTVVRDKGVCRMVVNVELLQRSVAVEIDRCDLLPVKSLPVPNTETQIHSGPAGPLWP